MSRLRSQLLGALLVASSPAVLACNALTGADELVIQRDGDDEGDGRNGGQPTAGAVGSVIADMALADGVTIREIALYQGVKRPLMADGQPSTSATPIVRGRDALLRVFVDLDERYKGAPVTAVLELDGQDPMTIVSRLRRSSSDDELASTFNFNVPGAALSPGVAYRVAVLQPQEQSTGANAGAIFPGSAREPLDVDPTESVIRVEIVPIEYKADGSSRKPDTSPDQLRQYEERFYALYPVSRVDLKVRSPVSFDTQVLADGRGWDELLAGLARYRNAQEAEDDVYYYGLFVPAPSFQEFCRNGCVAGLGFVSNPADVNSRVAIGLGFGGEVSIETAVHEIGHTHGRAHAPCGPVEGPDGDFPYERGTIGTWGYNLISKKLYDPDRTTDVMGYCNPIWISDYTFNALFQRVRFLSSRKVVVPEEAMNRRYEQVRIDGSGNARFFEPVTLRKPPLAETRRVTIESESGDEPAEGQFYKFDHLDGGILYVPQPARPFRSIRIELDGKSISAVR